jgi:hypothetical protein
MQKIVVIVGRADTMREGAIGDCGCSTAIAGAALTIVGIAGLVGTTGIPVAVGVSLGA